MHFVGALSFVRDQFVSGRNGDVNPHPERVPGMLRVVGMFDDDVAAADVIAKPIEARSLIANEMFELIGFFDSPIRNFHW